MGLSETTRTTWGGGGGGLTATENSVPEQNVLLN